MKGFKLALIAAAVFLTAACTDNPTAKRAAEAVGLTQVQTTGWRWFGCSEDDMFHTGFSAVNAQGRTVTGVVCNGWLKSATVRFD